MLRVDANVVKGVCGYLEHFADVCVGAKARLVRQFVQRYVGPRTIGHLHQPRRKLVPSKLVYFKEGKFRLLLSRAVGMLHLRCLVPDAAKGPTFPPLDKNDAVHPVSLPGDDGVVGNCADNIDNDNDGLKDAQDPGCRPNGQYDEEGFEHSQ